MPVPKPVAVAERGIDSFASEIVPAVESTVPSLDFDPPPKSRRILWVGLTAGISVLLLIVLALAFGNKATDSERVSDGTRPPTVPEPTRPRRVEPPVAKAPVVEAAGAKAEKSIEIAAGVKMRFCWIPAGKATLGSPASEKERSASEAERGYATEGFWLGKFTTTQGEYEAVVGSNPSQFQGGRLPVDSVSWADARACIEKMNEGAAGVALRKSMGDKAKFALPHEDAWEYACRGGSGNARPFYWGDSLDGDKANCDGTTPYGAETKGIYLETTAEVGAYEAKSKHPWGLCDMSGNVWQWCDNLYSSDGTDRAIRGGSWNCNPVNCRSAHRGWMDPTRRDSRVGFRLAVSEVGK